ncbi:hypothetical protein [Macrococcus animalis]|uniref:hypothetical protein n=1 Tax=Macrococcus animalis TaxID=3395467 RepID=UPI0039BE2B46
MNLILLLIIAAEIMFWVFIILGLIARYTFKKEKLSLILLSSTISVDLFLVICTTIDLRSGNEASVFHGIAAVYIGVSLMFGKQMIQYADNKYQVLILKRNIDENKLSGMDYARNYLLSYIKHIGAFIIAYLLIMIMKWLINDSNQTKQLTGIINIWQVVLIIDLIITISWFIWPKKRKDTVN